MFYFSVFVFGELFTSVQPVDSATLAELIQWAQNDGLSYSVHAV